MKPEYQVRLTGLEMPARVLNRRGVIVAIIYTDKEPGDQYETAALIVDALNRQHTLAESVTSSRSIPCSLCDGILTLEDGTTIKIG
jgi:ribosomal protein L25 (general stress protein Ctc)